MSDRKTGDCSLTCNPIIYYILEGIIDDLNIAYKQAVKIFSAKIRC